VEVVVVGSGVVEVVVVGSGVVEVVVSSSTGTTVKDVRCVVSHTTPVASSLLVVVTPSSEKAEPGFRVQGSGFRVQGSGFRVQG
jgi:hypothetical protein